MYSASYTPEDEFDFSTNNTGGIFLTPVVSFVLFLKSSCLCKKICQDAGLLMTVRITKSTDLWKTKKRKVLENRKDHLDSVLHSALFLFKSASVPKWLT